MFYELTAGHCAYPSPSSVYTQHGGDTTAGGTCSGDGASGSLYAEASSAWAEACAEWEETMLSSEGGGGFGFGLGAGSHNYEPFPSFGFGSMPQQHHAAPLPSAAAVAPPPPPLVSRIARETLANFSSSPPLSSSSGNGSGGAAMATDITITPQQRCVLEHLAGVGGGGSTNVGAHANATTTAADLRRLEEERLARQRRRLEALHEEIDDWAAEERRVERQEAAILLKARGEEQRREAPRTTAPAASTAVQPTEEKSAVAALPSSSSPLAPPPPSAPSPSSAADLSSLIVSLEGLDASLRLELQHQHYPFYDQADDKFTKGDYKGAAGLLEELERLLSASTDHNSNGGGVAGNRAASSKGSSAASSSSSSSSLAARYFSPTCIGSSSSISSRPLPVALLVNKALCYYKQRDFRACLKLLGPMMTLSPTAGGGGSQCDVASRASATGLTIAIRSAILLVDVRSAKAGLAMLDRVVRLRCGSGEGGGASPPPVLASNMVQYALVIRDLEHYRDCIANATAAASSGRAAGGSGGGSAASTTTATTNMAMQKAALGYITSACSNASFHHDVGLELLRVECLAAVRPREADEDIRALLEVFPAEASLWVWRAVLQLSEQEPLESLAIASQHLLRAVALDPAHPKARAMLKAMRLVNARLQSAQQHQEGQRWGEALADYATLVDGSVLSNSNNVSGGAAAAAAAANAKGGGPSAATVAAVDALLWNEVRELFGTSAVLSAVRVELLCCQLKSGDAKGVAAECSTILGYLDGVQQHHANLAALGGKSSSSSSLPAAQQQFFAHHSLLYKAQYGNPKAYRIRPAILASFRAQAYVSMGDYPRALADAKAVFKEAPSASSREFIAYIEGLMGVGGGGGVGGKGAGKSSHSYSSGRGGGGVSSAASAEATRKAYCTLLGVSVSATAAEVGKAYKAAALKWHPDKWVSASEEEQSAAEEHFKKLNQAYTCLQEGAR